MPPQRRAERDRARQRVDRSIRLRVRIYALIFLVMAVVVIVDMIGIGAAGILPALAGALGGVVVGVVASRMFSLSWDTVSSTVVGRLDALGAVVLVGYLLVSLFRNNLLDVWFDGPVLALAALAALAGVMAGQVIGTGRGVRQVLRLVATGPQTRSRSDRPAA